MSDSVLADFCAITGLNQERAKFFIDAAGGNLEVTYNTGTFQGFLKFLEHL